MVLNFSQWCSGDNLILRYCWFNSFFFFIAKGKHPFSWTCSFYCCLVLKRFEPWKLLSSLPSEDWLLINWLLIKNVYSNMSISVGVVSHHGRRVVNIFESSHKNQCFDFMDLFLILAKPLNSLFRSKSWFCVFL